MRLAIVGSTRFADPGAADVARHIIYQAIWVMKPDVVISGGAVGVDTFGEEIARTAGYSDDRLIIHRPRNQRWEPDGFKDRNLLIAQDCTHLLAIRCKQSKTYGSGWTADRAEELGKTVWRRFL